MKDFIKDFIYCSNGVRERHLILKSVFGLPIVILLGMFGMFDAADRKIERYQRQLESGVITKAEYEGYLYDLDQLARMDSLRQRLR